MWSNTDRMSNASRKLRRSASSNAGQSSAQRRRVCRRGPVGLTEVLDTVNENIEHLSAKGEEAIASELQGCVGIKYAITSSFSGVRTGEQAAVAVIEGLQEKQGLTVDGDIIIPYATWENNASLSPVLTSQCPTSHHQFGDLLDRLHKDDRTRLDNITRARLEDWASLSEQCKFFSKEELDALKEESSTTFIRELMHMFSTIDFKEQCPCLLHPGAACSISPRSCPQFAAHLWVEFASTRCQSHSKMNQARPGWLSWSTLSALVWVYSTRFYQPDLIIHEQVASWKEDLFIEILQASCTYKLSPTSRSLQLPEYKPGQHYQTQVEVWSPVDQGIPTRGERKYLGAWLASMPRHKTRPSFESLRDRSLEETAAVYLCADADTIKNNSAARAKRGGPQGGTTLARTPS